MSQTSRLPQGGRIDRARSLAFTFDGERLSGLGGDTLASALLANGRVLVGRSFKYHRPRGIVGLGAEEPNALVRLGSGAAAEPNARATCVELFDGLAAESQNRWPSLTSDLGAAAGLLAPILPAGFYYKTFMGPGAGAWRVYEWAIRRMAGLGRAPSGADPDRYEQRFAHCDLLVAGAGPAGLAAALAAGRSGARVIQADMDREAGGHLLAEGDDLAVDGQPALGWAAAVAAELDGMPNVQRLCRTALAGLYDGNYLTAWEQVTDHLGPGRGGGLPRQRLWRIRARQAVLATGALERPLVFAGNDRPGVMLSGALRGYLHRYAVLAGRRVCLMTNNDSAYRTAIALQRAGASCILADLRSDGTPLAAAARAAGVEVLTGHAVTQAQGGMRVDRVRLRKMSESGGAMIGGLRKEAVDILAMSGGWGPNVALFSQARGRLHYDPALTAFRPAGGPQGLRCAGGADGATSLQAALDGGVAAGLAAAADCGFDAAPLPPLRAEEPDVPADGGAGRVRAVWIVPGEHPVGRGPKQFVDFQNDVTAGDLQLAEREGFSAVEHMKRYTTTGMATDQGKLSGMNALGILAEMRGTSVDAVGHTTFRPPYVPVTFGAMAGRRTGPLFDPLRRTPMQGWHERQGALLETVGQWQRPLCFPQALPDGKREDRAAATRREVLAVRHAAGLLDASTLGKIMVEGPDAATFLNRLYVNRFDSLKPGHCRYGLMLTENGTVLDDGVVARLDARRFHVTTTTGGAAHVLDWMEELLQTEWPDLQAWCTSVTDHWAVATLSGPLSREILAPLTDIDLANAAFPFMTVREGLVCGAPARIFRVSFTGELSFEINLAARYGRALWDCLLAAGSDRGLVPFGTDAMHLLRAEKGFIMVGQESDGTTIPDDLGMAGMVKGDKGDFIGKRSLSRPDMLRGDRKQLVGLLTAEPRTVLREGAQIVAPDAPDPRPGQKVPMLGHVTSSYFSPTLNRSIALALVKGGRARIGEAVKVPVMGGPPVAASIAPPIFHDDKGAAARG
ncbi:MAG: sarcosine oxidase subunit alpha family protein [Sneathiellaceae bacterium]